MLISCSFAILMCTFVCTDQGRESIHIALFLWIEEETVGVDGRIDETRYAHHFSLHPHGDNSPFPQIISKISEQEMKSLCR